MLIKKLLGFIFISLFYCNLGFADVFLKNCKSILNNGEIKILDEGEKREYFVSYNDGIVYYTKVNSEFYLKLLYHCLHRKLPIRHFYFAC